MMRTIDVDNQRWCNFANARYNHVRPKIFLLVSDEHYHYHDRACIINKDTGARIYAVVKHLHCFIKDGAIWTDYEMEIESVKEIEQ